MQKTHTYRFALRDREEVLRLATQGTARDVSKPKKSDSDEDAILVGELGLPTWVTKTDLGGTLETLGNHYARKGNVEYAMPLYLQTISLLLPPPQARKHEPSTGDKCHAATIVSVLSKPTARELKFDGMTDEQSFFAHCLGAQGTVPKRWPNRTSGRMGEQVCGNCIDGSQWCHWYNISTGSRTVQAHAHCRLV